MALAYGLNSRNIKEILDKIADASEIPKEDYIKSAVGSFWKEIVYTRTFQFCLENNLIRGRDVGETKVYELTSDGVKFQVDQERIEEQKKHDETIKKVTKIIAFFTGVNVLILAIQLILKVYFNI